MNLAKLVREAFERSQGRVLPTHLCRQSIGQLLAMSGALPGTRPLSLDEAIARVNERRRQEGRPLVPDFLRSG